VGRLIALLLGGFGLVAYLRRRRQRSEREYSPADELRSKLAESRESDETPEPAAATPTAEPNLETELEERRREVHERARGAIDDLS
jgi:hypothetical protein